MATEPAGELTAAPASAARPRPSAKLASAWLDATAIAEAPVAIFTIDLLRRITSWNPAAEHLLGWSGEEVIGRPIPFLSEDILEAADRQTAELWKVGHVGDLEFSPTCKDGSRRHVVASASVLRDEIGRPDGALVFLTDVTERVAAARAVRESERKWKLMVRSISDTVTLLDHEARVLESSGETSDVLGYEPDEWRGLSALSLVHPEDLPRAQQVLATVLDDPGGEHWVVVRTRHKDGHYEQIEYVVVNQLHDPAVGGIVLTSRNVTEMKQAEALLAGEVLILELIARDAPLTDTLTALAGVVQGHTQGHVAVLYLDEDGGPLRVGGTSEGFPSALVDEILRAPRDWLQEQYHQAPELLLRPVADLEQATSSIPEVEAHRLGLLDLGMRAAHIVPVADRRGNSFYGVVVWYHDRAHQHTPQEEKVAAASAHLAAIAIDRARAQQELERAAWTDELTGLPNRNAVMARLHRALTSARVSGTTAAAMFVDLDNFKVVNDSLGHSAADRLLARTAQRLADVVPPDALVGHFSADEFVIVLDEVTGLVEPDVVAARIESALAQPFVLTDREVYLSASVGIALSDDAADAEALLQHADTALAKAKRLGRSRVEVFDTDLRAEATERLALERDLRLAVERGDLELHYQPKVVVATGEIVGAEALVRWDHPERGAIAPAEFIPIAEENGLIRRIGASVLEESVRQARAWIDAHPHRSDFVISVNLSARRLSSPNLLAEVSRILATNRWPAEQLMLELTESVLIDDAEMSLDALAGLKALGVTLAIDDFGTGYSSLNYLHRFPVDVVKIDRSFVTDLTSDGDGSPVAAAVMHVARALGLTACAEGVEDPAQLAGLRALGCDWAQGFLLCPPVPADELGALLAEGRTLG